MVHFLSNCQTIADKAILFQISLRPQKKGGRLPVLEDETHELLQLSKKVSNLGYLELIEGRSKTDQASGYAGSRPIIRPSTPG